MRTDNGVASVKEVYYNVSKKYPPLTAEAERKLIEDHNGNDEKIRDLLFFHNIRGALTLASRYKARISSEEDGIQKAMMGLYHASRLFDMSKNVRFLSYAAWWIVAELTKDLQRKDGKMDLVCMSLDSSVGKGNGEKEDATLLDFVHKIMDISYRADIDESSLNSTTSVDLSSDISKLIASILKKMPHIPQRDKDIYIDYFDLSEISDGHYSQKEVQGERTLKVIAERHGLTSMSIHNIITRVSMSVRRELTTNYNYVEEIRIRTRKIEKDKKALEDEKRKPEYKRHVEEIENEIKLEEEMIAYAVKEQDIHQKMSRTASERNWYEQKQARHLEYKEKSDSSKNNKDLSNRRIDGHYVSVTQNWDKFAILKDSRKYKKGANKKYSLVEWRPVSRWAYLLGLSKKNRRKKMEYIKEGLRTEEKRDAIFRKYIPQEVGETCKEAVSACTEGRENMTPNELMLASHEDEYETPHENIREVIELTNGGYTRIGYDEVDD